MSVERGERGDQGIQGPTGPQGVAGAGERGEQGDSGERGQRGRSGSSLRPRLALIGFVLLIVASTVSGFYAYRSNEQSIDNYQEIQQGRKVSSNAVCAFGGAIAEAGRAVLDAASAAPQGARALRFERNLERLGYPPRAQRKRASAGQAYVDSIARRVEATSGIKGLVVKHGPKAGTLDCDALQRAAKIK